MQELKILIVEDDENIRTTYHRNIESYNKTNDKYLLTTIFGENRENALGILQDTKNKFDGAIIDLDLKSAGGQDSSGNDVIREIKDKLRFPVFVISGNIHNLNKELNQPNDFFKVVARDDGDFDYIKEFISIYDTGITNLLNRNGEIEGLINDIFWNHLSSSLNIWIKDVSRDSEQKEKSLLRYTLLHMLEYLDENNVHPSEFYITRPVKNTLSTGDLISFKGNRYVVLTPACDFVPRTNGERNVRKAFLLRIIELNEHFTHLDESIKKNDISKTLKGKLEKVISNNKSYYHFIPKHNSIEAGIIDFQDKLSISIDEVEEGIKNKNIDRFATITLPFLKDLIERYSSYYARQGSPDFNVDDIINGLLN